MKTIFKCVTSFLLIFSVIMSNFLHIDVTAENTNAVTLINIPLCSNIIQDESTTLYEINDSYYMTLAQIVQLTGFEIALGKDTNNGDLHIFDFDDSFDVIGKGYNTVTFIDGIREVKINLESEYLYESGEHYAIRIEKYENQYLLEAIPLLKYLLGVDSCDMIDGVFRCEAPYETIWKALSDAFELSKAVCYDYSYFYEEYEKRIFFDISYQCFMDLRIPKIEEYYRKTIHDILSDNIYEYDGVQTISNEQDEYHSLDDLLDVVDVSKDVINNSASRITEQYINHQLQNLNTEWLETSDVRKSAELSKQINIKINELVNSKNYFDKMDSGLKAIMYGANIANAFAKNYAYNYDTATLLDDAIDKDLLSNINTENWYWLDEANRINSSIKSNWSNIGNSVLDSTVKLFEDEGNDLLICSIAENASSYLLIVKAELMVGKLIFKDNYEIVDKDILSGFESDLQAQYKQLCNVLYLKARNELYTSEKTIDQMLAAYKFYYKLSAVYLKNVSIQFEQNNWMEDYADDAAKMYYRLLTCFKTPNLGFEKLEDDVFSQETISQIKVVDYEEIYYSYIENELIPKYGTCSNYKDVFNVVDYQVDLSLLPSGFLNYSISDFNNDNTKELLVTYCSNRLDEYYQQYHTISLQLYTIDSSKQVVLSDEIATASLSGYYTNYFYKLFTVKNTTNEKFICSFEKYSVNGISSKLAICKVDSNCKFKLCDILIDPGYTSAVGLYHSNSLQANQIYESRYSDCEEIYEVDFSTDEQFDDSIFYGLINDIIRAYGISAYSVNDYTDYDISAENEDQILNVDYHRNYENNTATINITTNDMLLMDTTSDDAKLELQPDVHYYGSDVVNGITLNYDLYLLQNKTTIMVSTPTEIGGTISYVFNSVSYNNGIYSYSNGIESEMVPNAIRSLVATTDNTGTIAIIDDATIEWTNTSKTTGRNIKVTLTKSTNDITVQKEPTVINTATWQQLYAEELNNYINSHDYVNGAMFDLLDLDSDGIPELIISAGECHMCTCDIYGVKNGDLNLICKGISEWGTFTAYKDGVICATWTPSGPGQKITSTQFIKISNGSSEVLYDLTAEGFPPDYDKYTINGAEVSANEHDEVKMQYITQEPLQYSVGRKYTLDEGTINSVLLSSGT